ncbi:hypothetical protein Cgig2_026162 [Carnegiea gigantea]|uniref:peptidylprolyl isomerase n=1 Tax=Carnegiea gigantea TaxID=171969 RepID=A0A9Q1JM41_9CARY|nr:hypothetical protein Cgig2_026162 [Carnegiea gigantea]
MGIGTMTRGEKAIIYVREQYLTESSLLHETVGLEEVHFEVELVHFIQVRDVLGDGRLIKRRICDGQGEFPMDCPLQDSQLRVHYKGRLLDDKKTIFYDTRIDNDGQPLEFCSGEGLVPEGFEMCVRLMLPGETALVTCPPDYAYDKFPRPANVPEGAFVEWEIELLGFEMPQDWTGLDFRSIMNEAEKIRSTGNRLFKEGKYELAKAKYEKVCALFLCHEDLYMKVGLCTRALCGEVTSKNTFSFFEWALVNTLGSLVGNRLVNGDVQKYNSQRVAVSVNKNVPLLELLREFNHVNPQDDEEGKEFLNTRVCLKMTETSCPNMSCFTANHDIYLSSIFQCV